MEDSEYWFRKRMEDIPKPIPLGKSNLSEEDLKRGREEGNRLLKKYGIIKDDKPPV